MRENSTVSFKSIKTVTIKTQNQDKRKYFTLLVITVGDKKLPLLIIFMAKEAGHVEKNY